MNQHLRHAVAESADWRIVTKIFGGLLGPEFIISTGGKTYRIGQPSLTQLERGALVEEMDMLEVDESGNPIDGAE